MISNYALFTKCIVCASFLILQYDNYAQSTKLDIKDYDLIESYTITEVISNLTPKGLSPTSLNVIDQMSMAPRKEVSRIVNTLDKKGNVTNTIYHERPAHLEKWIQHPAITIITVDATTLYDAKGNVLNKFAHDTKTKDSKKSEVDKIKKSGKFQDVDFSQLTGQQKSDLAKAKGKVKKLSFFAEEIEYDSLIIRNVPEKLVKQFIQKDKAKNSKGSSTAFKYKLSKDDDLFLESVTSLSPKTYVFKDGTDAIGVLHRTNLISDYSLSKSSKYAKVKGRSVDGLITLSVLSTLVGDDYLGLSFSNLIPSESLAPVQFSIYDVNGFKVLDQSVSDYFHGVSIDIANLNTGVYFINSNLTAGQSPVKFIKI